MVQVRADEQMETEGAHGDAAADAAQRKQKVKKPRKKEKATVVSEDGKSFVCEAIKCVATPSLGLLYALPILTR